MSVQVLDPTLVSLISNRLSSILNEQQAALVQTAFSTIVRESLDLACGVFDTRGEMIAQSDTGTPGHINAMATGVRHFLDAFPPDSLAPGDILLTNDPWKTSGQVNDLTLVTPVFRDEVLVGLFASTCHSPDIGGRLLSGEAREVYEEGLQLPIMKLARAGELNDDLITIIRANVRTPDETVGDIHAQAAGNAVGARGLLTMLDEFGLETVDPVAAEIMDRSDRAMRAAIEALPDGRYEHEGGSDGFNEPVVLRAAVTIDGDEIAIDFDGSSGQSPYGINLVLNYTHAYASFAMKAAIAPEVPHNAGSFRPVSVTAPPGSVLNCNPPAPVASRHLIGHLLPGVLFGALAPALPGRLIAGSADAVWATVWRGRSAACGPPFNVTLFHAGGTGARAVKDGLSTTGFPSGVGAVPTEVVESLTPLVVQRRALRQDSAGAGRQRGGLGQTIETTARDVDAVSISALTDRTQFPAQGFDGAGSGATGSLRRSSGAVLPSKRTVTLDPTDGVVLDLPGGGGYGDPLDREPELVLQDVIEGYVSVAQARELYGVVVEYLGPPGALVRPPSQFALRRTETTRLRRARKGGQP